MKGKVQEERFRGSQFPSEECRRDLGECPVQASAAAETPAVARLIEVREMFGPTRRFGKKIGKVVRSQQGVAHAGPPRKGVDLELCHFCVNNR